MPEANAGTCEDLHSELRLRMRAVSGPTGATNAAVVETVAGDDRTGIPIDNRRTDIPSDNLSDCDRRTLTRSFVLQPLLRLLLRLWHERHERPLESTRNRCAQDSAKVEGGSVSLPLRQRLAWAARSGTKASVGRGAWLRCLRDLWRRMEA